LPKRIKALTGITPGLLPYKVSYFALTDSGGIQEEAPALGKPVLVMREVTERQEGVEAGTAKLVGTDFNRLVSTMKELLEDKTIYTRMANTINPYGDGTTSKQIVEIVKKLLIVCVT
jgi:UDP-N-acetylglucosamine 2-epimerase (non-hydrolysing)